MFGLQNIAMRDYQKSVTTGQTDTHVLFSRETHIYLPDFMCKMHVLCSRNDYPH